MAEAAVAEQHINNENSTPSDANRPVSNTRRASAGKATPLPVSTTTGTTIPPLPTDFLHQQLPIETQSVANPYAEANASTQRTNGSTTSRQTDYNMGSEFDNLRSELNGAEHDTTGTDHHYALNDTQQQQNGEAELSAEQLIQYVQQLMLLYESNAQYLEAENAKKQLQQLQAQLTATRVTQLSTLQQHDINLFFTMVGEHQSQFDNNWNRKFYEHKVRADELIAKLRSKHESEQHQLYSVLAAKKPQKYSVELLNLRQRQLFLAKQQEYMMAQKIKVQADKMEKAEVGTWQGVIVEETRSRLQILAKKQALEREQLSSKLALERRALIEAKNQDFQRLKKRLKNAEQELKRTHVRQQLLAEKKLTPQFSTQSQHNGGEYSGQQAGNNNTSNGKSSSRHNSLSKSGSNIMNGQSHTIGSETSRSAKQSKMTAVYGNAKS